MYRLAVKLGKANVDELKRSLTAKQIMNWMAYAELEPFDERRQDVRIASIVQMIANVNRGKDQKPFTLNDVLLKFGIDQEELVTQKKQTPAQQFEIAKLWAKMMAVETDVKGH